MKRLLSLCAGIGVIDYVWSYILHQEIAGQVEINDFCQTVLTKRFPDVERASDLKVITEDDYARFGTVDVVAGGIPCQPFSDAGKRRGTDDDRHLWPYAFAIVQRCRPAWVLIENVTGFVSMALDLVSSDLESEDYEVQAYVLPACAVGAPHERKRIFIVAHSNRNGYAWQESTLTSRQCRTAEPTSLCRRENREEMANPDRQGLAVGEIIKGYARTQCASTQRSCDNTPQAGIRSVEPRLGRESYGVANWLDRSQWPACPGQSQHEWEPARILPRRRGANRNNRLEALGNAIVPQQVYPFLKFIADWQEQ